MHTNERLTMTFMLQLKSYLIENDTIIFLSVYSVLLMRFIIMSLTWNNFLSGSKKEKLHPTEIMK